MTISGNTSNYGAGVRVNSSGDIRIWKNTIIDNKGSNYGGGIFISGDLSSTGDGSVTIRDNTIRGNQSSVTAGNVQVTAREVTIDNNDISHNLQGKGVYLDNSGNSNHIWRITNNRIVHNAKGGGSGIKGCGANGLISFINNIISYNEQSSSSGGGGGINLPLVQGGLITLTNNTISHNSTIDSGGGGGVKWIQTKDTGILEMHSNIIWNNSATNFGDDLYLDNDGNNNLLYTPFVLLNNDFDQSSNGFYIKELSYYSNIDPSNLNSSNPLFVDPENEDFRLTAASPCINAGNNQAPQVPLYDIRGQARIMGGGVDIGAYEYPGEILPVALFSAEPRAGSAPLAVSFHDESLGNITSRLWDFGDGSSSIEQHPVHTYAGAGSYTVNLTVTGDGGSDSDSKVDYVTASLHHPVASTGVENGITCHDYIFDASDSTDPDGDIVNYQWHLAHRTDPAYNRDAVGVAPTVSGLWPGFYDVTLTVTDNDGLIGNDYMELAVCGTCDIGGDGNIGLEEAIHILRTLSGN